MKLTKRELWLMEKSFSAGTYYGSFDEWLNEHVCNEANVQMVLEAEAPDPVGEKVIEAANKAVFSVRTDSANWHHYMSEESKLDVANLASLLTEFQKVTP